MFAWTQERLIVNFHGVVYGLIALKLGFDMSKIQQVDKFKQAAKETECDTDEKKFDRSLGEIAKVESKPNKDMKPAKEQR